VSAAHDPREDVLGKAYDARLVKRLAAFARPYSGLVALSLALLFAGGAVQLLQPWLLKVAIDDAILAGHIDRLVAPALGFLATLAAEFVLGYLQIYALERTGQNVVLDIRHAVFAHLQKLSLAYFNRKPTGNLIARITNDTVVDYLETVTETEALIEKLHSAGRDVRAEIAGTGAAPDEQS